MKKFLLAMALLVSGCAPPEGTPERANYNAWLRHINQVNADYVQANRPRFTNCTRTIGGIDCTTY